MSERRDRDSLEDILEASRRARRYTAGMDYAQFVRDSKTQDAVIRNLEIIGEATKRLSDDLRADHEMVPWKNMAGLRDRLIHDYFGVNLDIVWQIASDELPAVQESIRGIIAKMD